MKTEVLKFKQKEVWPGLKAFKNFRLVGGTALALQMGHRVSVDFDMFSNEPLSQRLYAKIKREFLAFPIRRAVNLPEQLTVKVGEVKMDFVYDKYKFVQKAKKLDGVYLATVPEIAAMKAFTLSFRGSNKDYYDLYFILKERRCALEDIRILAEKKYGDEFNFLLFLQQLFYLENIKKEQIEFLKKEPSEKEMRNLFKQKTKKLKI